MTEIENIKVGESVRGKYAVRVKNWLREYKSKPGKFFSIEIGDKSGDIGLKYWGGADGQRATELYNSIRVGDVIEITGDAIMDPFEKRLIVVLNEDTNRFRKCEPEEYDVGNYLPETKKNVDEMLTEFKRIIDSVREEHLNRLLHKFFDDRLFLNEFKTAPAATSKHHSYLGGNLEHVLNVVRLCETMCESYPELNRDLLVTSAILHDVGKLREYAYMTSIERTDEGKLVGHIVLGDRLISEKLKEIEGFPDNLKMKLSHSILTHHGKIEYGSPVWMKTPEACALHYADETDARVKEFLQVIEKGEEIKDDWLFAPGIGREVYLR